MIRFATVLFLAAYCYTASPAQEKKTPPTAQEIWRHFSTLPGDQIFKKKLSKEEAKKVREDKAVHETEEFFPKEEPRDAGSLRFYVDQAKGQYWSRRINMRNPSDPDWMAGPFVLPKK